MLKTAALVVSLALSLGLGATVAASTVTGLRCEYLTDPLGIDVTQPRLSWMLQSTTRGEKQAAYHVLVASTKELLKEDRGDLWDSGKVDSDQSVHVAYAGPSTSLRVGQPLVSRQHCFWKVRVWTLSALKPESHALNPSASAWSPPAFWSMGLLKPEDWKARWIGLETEAVVVSIPSVLPDTLDARYLRREFTTQKKVKCAMAYI